MCRPLRRLWFFFFFQAEDGIRYYKVTGVQTCALPIFRKHRPSLLEEARGASRRLDFLERCVDLAVALRAPVVSTWSGRGPDGLDPEAGLARLARGLEALCAHASGAGLRIGFEPEPGMAVETVAQW